MPYALFIRKYIDKCVEKAYAIIDEKNPALENKRDVAEKVGVGAVIFGALANNKIKEKERAYKMNYELIKNEFIKFKKEELYYIDSIAKISNNKTLSEKVRNNIINRKTVYIHTLGDWILLRWQFYSN